MSENQPLITKQLNTQQTTGSSWSDSIAVYTGGCGKISEVLSRVVYNNLSHGKRDVMKIYVFAPNKPFSQILKFDETVRLVIQNKSGKTKSTLLYLSKTNYSEDDNYIVFYADYINPYKTGKDTNSLVVEWRENGTLLSKKLFTINIFSKSIPWELGLPSCWNNFVSLSRETHCRIESGKDKKEELERLLKIWDCIFSMQEEESKEMVTNFLRIHSNIPNNVNSNKVLSKSSLLMIMYIMFNCEQIPEFNKLSSVVSKFEDFIDALVGSCNGTAVEQKTMKFLMQKLLELKLVEVGNFASVRTSLLTNLGSEFSKYLCMLHLGGSTTTSAISCLFQIQEILSREDLNLSVDYFAGLKPVKDMNCTRKCSWPPIAIPQSNNQQNNPPEQRQGLFNCLVM